MGMGLNSGPDLMHFLNATEIARSRQYSWPRGYWRMAGT